MKNVKKWKFIKLITTYINQIFYVTVEWYLELMMQLLHVIIFFFFFFFFFLSIIVIYYVLYHFFIDFILIIFSCSFSFFIIKQDLNYEVLQKNNLPCNVPIKRAALQYLELWFPEPYVHYIISFECTQMSVITNNTCTLVIL